MIEAARVYDYEATETLLDDWIKKGFVGRAQRAGLGCGHGSVAWWFSTQFTLFTECLQLLALGVAGTGKMA